MFKVVIFILLAVLTAAFAILGIMADEGFFRDLWSQLFWLTAGVIATTFILERILQHDEASRRRAEDAFAFRTFTAYILTKLLEMSECITKFEDDLFVAALSGKYEFDALANKAAQTIATSTGFRRDVYRRSYLDISNNLRDLARNYIRLFASSREEMVRTYRELEQLAATWEYKDEFSEGYQEYTNSLTPGDDERQRREAKMTQEESEAKVMLSQTATYIGNLAHKAATTRGMPAV